MLTAPQINPALPDDMKPDIYYIILYGYARSDTLAELYAFDNSSFLSFLENQIR